jgi:hypothetical protein
LREELLDESISSAPSSLDVVPMDNVGQDLDGGLEFEVVVRVNNFIVNKF